MLKQKTFIENVLRWLFFLTKTIQLLQTWLKLTNKEDDKKLKQ